MDPNQPQPQSYPQYPPRTIPYSPAWQKAKLVLYPFLIVFSIIVLAIAIYLVVAPDIESIVILWAAPTAGVGLCWAIAELITVCARSGHRGIHPGAHVALHLLLWLGYLASIGLTAYFLAFALECDYYCQRYSYYSYSPGGYVPSLQALEAFMALLFLLHFTLFVRACVECSHRNRMRSPIVMVPQNMYYAQPMAPQYPMQSAPPMQHPGHTSEYYGQPKDVPSHSNGSTHLSQTSGPTQVHEDGLHPVQHHQ